MKEENNIHRNYELQEFIFDDEIRDTTEIKIKKYRSDFAVKTDKDYAVNDINAVLRWMPLFEELKYYYNNDVCIACAVCLSVMETNKYNLRTYAYYYESAVHRIEAVWEYVHILLGEILGLELVVGKDIYESNIKYRTGTWDFVKKDGSYNLIFKPYTGKKLEAAIEAAKKENILLNISSNRKKSIFHKNLKKKISINSNLGKIQELYFSEEACEMHRIRNEMVHRRPLGSKFTVGPFVIGPGQAICVNPEGWFSFKDKDILLEKNLYIIRDVLHTIQEIIYNHDLPNTKVNESEEYICVRCKCPSCNGNIIVPKIVFDYFSERNLKVPCARCGKNGLILLEEFQVDDRFYYELIWQYNEAIAKHLDANLKTVDICD